MPIQQLTTAAASLRLGLVLRRLLPSYQQNLGLRILHNDHSWDTGRLGIECSFDFADYDMMRIVSPRQAVVEIVVFRLGFCNAAWSSLLGICHHSLYCCRLVLFRYLPAVAACLKFNCFFTKNNYGCGIAENSSIVRLRPWVASSTGDLRHCGGLLVDLYWRRPPRAGADRTPSRAHGFGHEPERTDWSCPHARGPRLGERQNLPTSRSGLNATINAIMASVLDLSEMYHWWCTPGGFEPSWLLRSFVRSVVAFGCWCYDVDVRACSCLRRLEVDARCVSTFFSFVRHILFQLKVKIKTGTSESLSSYVI